MKVIKTQDSVSSIGKEDAIHIILLMPMLDRTYIDSIIRLLDEVVLWRFAPHDTYGISDNFIRAVEHSADGATDLWGIYPTRDNFLSMLEKYYPEDLDFFIWHPEVFNGEYHE